MAYQANISEGQDLRMCDYGMEIYIYFFPEEGVPGPLGEGVGKSEVIATQSLVPEQLMIYYNLQILYNLIVILFFPLRGP